MASSIPDANAVPHTTESQQWKCGESYKYPMTPDKDKDHWESLLTPLLEQDADQCKAWREEVANLLLFSGLFATVLAAFIVVSYSTLQPDENATIISLLEHIALRLDSQANASFPAPHPLDSSSSGGAPSLTSPPATPSVLINALWFTSLVLSLASSLIGIISLQWLSEHERYPSSLAPQDKFALFHMRAEGLRAWCVPQIFAVLPLLLQLSLVLFFAGLIAFLVLSSWAVAVPVIVVIGIALIFLLITTVVPALQMLAFCLPLGAHKRVLPQCPYKSPQSKAFQRIIIFSDRLVRIYFYFVQGLNVGYYALLRPVSSRGSEEKPVLTIDPSGLDFLLAAIVEARNAKSWVSFDKTWLVLRDVCARCIFEGTAYINEFHSRCLTEIGKPLYDAARGISSVTSEVGASAGAGGGDTHLVACAYFCVHDLSSSALRSVSPDASGNNRYLQTLLFSGDLKNPLPTFADYFDVPDTAFMHDENRFIFLSRLTRLSTGQLRHFAELHVRMMGYLYERRTPMRRTRTNLNSKGRMVLPRERPTYPNVQLLNYGSAKNGGGVSVGYHELFDDDMYSQFSSLINTFFNTAWDRTIPDPEFLASFYGQPLGSMFQSLFALQKPASSLRTLRSLSDRLKGLSLEPANLGKRSDYFFYACAVYARAHWLEHGLGSSGGLGSDLDTSVTEAEGAWARDGETKALLTALHTYANSDHNRDRELGKRLGIPDAHDKWWDFLNA